jgi:hypothetical protein
MPCFPGSCSTAREEVHSRLLGYGDYVNMATASRVLRLSYSLVSACIMTGFALITTQSQMGSSVEIAHVTSSSPGHGFKQPAPGIIQTVDVVRHKDLGQ